MDLLKKIASRKLGIAVGSGAVLSAASPEAIGRLLLWQRHIFSGKRSSTPSGNKKKRVGDYLPTRFFVAIFGNYLGGYTPVRTSMIY